MDRPVITMAESGETIYYIQPDQPVKYAAHGFWLYRMTESIRVKNEMPSIFEVNEIS